MREEVPGLARYERDLARHDEAMERAEAEGIDTDDPDFDIEDYEDDEPDWATIAADMEADRDPGPDYGRYI